MTLSTKYKKNSVCIATKKSREGNLLDVLNQVQEDNHLQRDRKNNTTIPATERRLLTTTRSRDSPAIVPRCSRYYPTVGRAPL